MGLYDDRLADLKETRRVQARTRRVPVSRSNPRNPKPSKSTAVQSLLFKRDSGWTSSKAKAWAQTNGYRHGKVNVTDQYVRLRQFDPKGSKAERTVPFGPGIRAVVAREETMRTAKEAPRRRRRTAKKKTTAKRPRRRARKVAVAAPKRRRRKKARVQARRTRRRASTGRVMQVKATRRRRRKSSPRRRVRASVQAWRGDKTRHATAARKGWKRRKKAVTSAAPKRRRRRKSKVKEMVLEAPRKKRRTAKRRRPHARRRVRSGMVMQAPRKVHRRRSRHVRASTSRSGGLGYAELGLIAGFSGLGFVLADGLDRFLATYDPSGAEKPKDKFTSDGAGTLANTLNIASRPSLVRIGAGLAVVAAPAVGSVFIKKNPLVRASVQGLAIGAGINAFKTLWNSFVMPLLAPAEATLPNLQKSYVARLYPAEIAASINLKQSAGVGVPVSSAGSGALSGVQTGVGDVGPFALAGDSPYPDASQAIRQNAGLHDQFPSLQNTWGTGGPGSDYPTAAQALRAGVSAPASYGNPGQPGVGWDPNPPSDIGPGPQAQPHKDTSCGCIGEANPYLSFLGDKPNEEPFYNTGSGN